MTHETIREFVEGKLKDKVRLLGLEVPDLTDDLPLTGSGIFDSMDFFGLITDVEEEFGVEVDFTEHEPSEFTTLAGFVRCVIKSAGELN